MRLSPLLALGVPELDRGQACPGHAEIRGVEHIAGRAVQVDRAVTETENLERRKFAALQMSDGTKQYRP